MFITEFAFFHLPGKSRYNQCCIVRLNLCLSPFHPLLSSLCMHAGLSMREREQKEGKNVCLGGGGEKAHHESGGDTARTRERVKARREESRQARSSV